MAKAHDLHPELSLDELRQVHSLFVSASRLEEIERLWVSLGLRRDQRPVEYTQMTEAVRRAYEALRKHNGPSLEVVERRAREEFAGSIAAACATGMYRHLTIYGEPRPSMVREPLSDQAHYLLGYGSLRFADDASKLVDNNGREVWANLVVRSAELLAHLKAIHAE